MTKQQRKALAQIKALIVERVGQVRRGEVVDGSITQIAERALQVSDKNPLWFQGRARITFKRD